MTFGSFALYKLTKQNKEIVGQGEIYIGKGDPIDEKKTEEMQQYFRDKKWPTEAHNAAELAQMYKRVDEFKIK